MGKIIVTVSPTGQTKIETKGFAGGSCKQVTKQLEAALGVKTSDTPTAEMYGAASAQNKQQARS